jgi:predicted DNA binding CopG/RHH family protein
MTQEDIIRMAREANRYASHQTGDSFEWQEIRDERFAALVAAAEREACAKVAETTICDTHLPTGVRIYGSKAAAAIRARSKT